MNSSAIKEAEHQYTLQISCYYTREKANGQCWQVASKVHTVLKRRSLREGLGLPGQSACSLTTHSPTNTFCHLPRTRWHAKNLFIKAFIDFPLTWNSPRVSLLSESPSILDACTMWNAGLWLGEGRQASPKPLREELMASGSESC